MRYINNDTTKFKYTVVNYLCMDYTLANSNILAVFKPKVLNGTIYLEVRNISNSLSIINSQHIASSNPDMSLVQGSK